MQVSEEPELELQALVNPDPCPLGLGLNPVSSARVTGVVNV